MLKLSYMVGAVSQSDIFPPIYFLLKSSQEGKLEDEQKSAPQIL